MLDRKTAPPFVKNFSFNLITPDHEVLSNGLHVYFVRGGDQHVIKLDFIFNAGRWYESLCGLSYFTSSLINKGTSDKTSFDIAALFDQLGAHLEIQADHDFVTVSLYSLTRNLAPSLELLLEILQQASFPEREVQQSKAIYQQNLKINKEKTSFLASRLFRKTLFTEGHPYGRELDEHDVEAISRGHLTQFHHDFFHDCRIFISGYWTAPDSSAVLTMLERFPAAPGLTRDHQDVHTAATHHHVDKKGSIQSSLRVGKRVIARSHPDYPSLLLLNHILGGFFGSRLMKNIREEKGLTYGIHSSIHALRHASFLIIGTDVNKESRELAFDEIRKEFKKLCTEIVPNDELDTARYHFIGSVQAELSTAFAHADKIRNIVLFDLDVNYYSNLIEAINTLSAEQLLSTANQYFNEGSFFEISVG